jgi:hypothetical protein
MFTFLKSFLYVDYFEIVWFICRHTALRLKKNSHILTLFNATGHRQRIAYTTSKENEINLHFFHSDKNSYYCIFNLRFFHILKSLRMIMVMSQIQSRPNPLYKVRGDWGKTDTYLNSKHNNCCIKLIFCTLHVEKFAMKMYHLELRFYFLHSFNG